MNYAIETLEIELAKCKEALRVQKIYSVYPEYKGHDTDYTSLILELKRAIELLETQKVYPRTSDNMMAFRGKVERTSDD